MTLAALIETLHGKGTFRRSAARLPGGVETFARVLDGKGIRTALEIGTYRGVSAAVMAQYVDRVITIDLRHGRLERDGVTLDRLAFWHSLGLRNIEYLPVADDMDKARQIAGLQFDFAFIDGAHNADSVRNDFAMVKHCGRVLFHDYDDSGRQGLDFVYTFVNTLPARQVEIMDGFAMWTAA